MSHPLHMCTTSALCTTVGFPRNAVSLCEKLDRTESGGCDVLFTFSNTWHPRVLFGMCSFCFLLSCFTWYTSVSLTCLTLWCAGLSWWFCAPPLPETRCTPVPNDWWNGTLQVGTRWYLACLGQNNRRKNGFTVGAWLLPLQCLLVKLTIW